ncbi:hypothetical protein GCM10022289_41000 [Pedobacter jeongneungensis]|uniref:Uncharacterized protein n=1 Tax=Pedobacter jeongneungensis TaxID=947309 RepID=A0ABP8BNT2_9SPHI
MTCFLNPAEFRVGVLTRGVVNCDGNYVFIRQIDEYNLVMLSENYGQTDAGN